MPKSDLACQWLKANDPDRQPKPRMFASRPGEAVPYYPHDCSAIAGLQEAEVSRPRRLKRRGASEAEVASLRGIGFIRANVGFDGEQCLFMPNMKAGQRSSVRFRGKNMAASRAMCIIAHGEPCDGEQARHLCGNGHLSCINPKHLAWGTPIENAGDTVLHRSRPFYMPKLAPETIAEIRRSIEYPPVLAIRLGLPLSIVEHLQCR